MLRRLSGQAERRAPSLARSRVRSVRLCTGVFRPFCLWMLSVSSLLPTPLARASSSRSQDRSQGHAAISRLSPRIARAASGAFCFMFGDADASTDCRHSRPRRPPWERASRLLPSAFDGSAGVDDSRCSKMFQDVPGTEQRPSWAGKNGWKARWMDMESCPPWSSPCICPALRCSETGTRVLPGVCVSGSILAAGPQRRSRL